MSRDLKQDVLIKDGGLGSLLWPQLAGVASVELLNLQAPDKVLAVHQAFLNAGATALSTNSFCADARSLARVCSQQSAAEVNRRAAELCREVAGQQALVLGSIGPGWLSPGRGEVSLASLTEAYQAQAFALIQGDVDWLWIETVRDPIQAQAAIQGARQALLQAHKDLPIAILATLASSGKEIGDLSLNQALDSLIALEPDLLGLNCSDQPQSLRQALAYLLEQCRLPIALCPNAGLPENALSPATWVQALRHLTSSAQVKVWGGCCGATPQHIQALSESFKQGLA